MRFLGGKFPRPKEPTASANVRDGTVSGVFVAGAERVMETQSGEGRRLGPGRRFKDFGFFCEEDRGPEALWAVE